jgi:hypothetical protein
MAYYDRADWHSGGVYPADLPPENGGTHIGMFLAWAILNKFVSDMHRTESSDALVKVCARKMTGREFLSERCDDKFSREDLNDEGNAFAHYYYESEDDDGLYYKDYERVLARGLPTMYHVADTWQNFDKIAPVISKRFKEWKEGKPGCLGLGFLRKG